MLTHVSTKERKKNPFPTLNLSKHATEISKYGQVAPGWAKQLTKTIASTLMTRTLICKFCFVLNTANKRCRLHLSISPRHHLSHHSWSLWKALGASMKLDPTEHSSPSSGCRKRPRSGKHPLNPSPRSEWKGAKHLQLHCCIYIFYKQSLA